MRRLAIILAAIFLFTFAFSRLQLLYSHKFFDVTGPAEWIWMQHRMAQNVPVAFFATRDFDLPADRYFTKIKIAADPEYTLYFNGQQVAGRRGQDGDLLDVYDVSALARTGRNRIVIAARSANGVGGVIAAVDIRPDFLVVPTGRDWNIVRVWSDDLPLRDPPRSLLARPMLLGRPPARRWNYLTRRPGEFLKPITRVVAPRRAFRMVGALPEISIKGGVAVAGSAPTPAIVYDFGFIDGRVRLVTTPGLAACRLVRARMANAAAELPPPEGDLESFVFAPGERMLTEPRRHSFRYVMVYGGDASAQAVQ